MRIIVIVDVRSDAVQQCSVLRVDLHLTVVTQHSGRGSAVERGQDIVLVGDVSSGHADGVSSRLVSDSLTEKNGLLYRNGHCWMVTSTHRTSGPVVEALHGSADDVFWDVGVSEGRCPSGKVQSSHNKNGSPDNMINQAKFYLWFYRRQSQAG